MLIIKLQEGQLLGPWQLGVCDGTDESKNVHRKKHPIIIIFFGEGSDLIYSKNEKGPSKDETRLPLKHTDAIVISGKTTEYFFSFRSRHSSTGLARFIVILRQITDQDFRLHRSRL